MVKGGGRQEQCAAVNNNNNNNKNRNAWTEVCPSFPSVHTSPVFCSLAASTVFLHVPHQVVHVVYVLEYSSTMRAQQPRAMLLLLLLLLIA